MDDGPALDSPTIRDLQDELSAITQQVDAHKDRVTQLREILRPIEESHMACLNMVDERDLETTKKMLSPPPVVRRAVELLVRILSTGEKATGCTGNANTNAAAEGRLLRLTSSNKSLDWKRDCLRALKKNAGKEDLSSRMKKFVPRVLARHPEIVNSLYKTYIHKNWKDDKESDASPNPSSRSTTRSKRRVGRASRVTPLFVSGVSAVTAEEKNPLLTLEKVAYANKSCAAILEWCVGQLDYATVLSNHGGDLHESIESSEIQICKGEREVRRLQDALRSEKNFLREEAVRLSHELDSMSDEIGNSFEAKENAHLLDSATVIPTIDEACEETSKYLGRSHESGVHVAENVVLSRIAVKVQTVLHFKEGETQLNSRVSLRAVEDVIEVMKDQPDVFVEITANGADLVESQTRAEEVERRMVSHGGISVGRIRISTRKKSSHCHSRDPKLSGKVTIRAVQEIRLLGTIRFTQMSSEVDTEDESTMKLLHDLSLVLRLRPTVRVRVEGHTDSSPSWGKSNQELSKERANSVACLLTKKFGVPINVISSTVGWGESRPCECNGSPSGRARNRRVEFHVEEMSTARSMRELWQEEETLEGDVHALNYLHRLASGIEPSSYLIRRAAADVLVASHEDWEVLRLLWIASRKENRKSCALALLSSDIVREICRAWFYLGGSGSYS